MTLKTIKNTPPPSLLHPQLSIITRRSNHYAFEQESFGMALKRDPIAFPKLDDAQIAALGKFATRRSLGVTVLPDGPTGSGLMYSPPITGLASKLRAAPRLIDGLRRVDSLSLMGNPLRSHRGNR